MTAILLPKGYTPVDGPIIFLAGPIRGAPAWQDDAIDIIRRAAPTIAIANPSRDIAERHAPRVTEHTAFPYERQRQWELHYIDLAQRTGAQLFWLPGEVSHKCEKSYGAMTRMELGEALVEYRHDPSRRIVIGSDGNFSELRTVLVDIEQYAPSLLPLHTTLEETCLAAIRLAQRPASRT